MKKITNLTFRNCVSAFLLTGLCALTVQTVVAQNNQKPVVKEVKKAEHVIVEVKTDGATNDNLERSIRQMIENGDTSGVTKTMMISYENCVKTMTVTTIKDGVTETQEFQGEEVDKYLKENGHEVRMVNGSGEQEFMQFWTGDNIEEIRANGHEMVVLKHLGNDSVFDTDVEVKIQELMDSEAITEMVKVESTEDGGFNIVVDGEVIVKSEDLGENIGSGNKMVVKSVFITKSVTLQDWNEEDDVEKVSGRKALELESLGLYPNPNNGQFKLEFESESNEPVDIRIADMQGRTVYESQINGDGHFSEMIDLSSEAKGIYVLTLHQGKKSTNKKLVIE